MTRLKRLRTPAINKQAAWHALVRHFTRTDRVLSGRRVYCQMDTSTQYPAWTIGSSIFFSAELVPDLKSMDDYVVATGLNYHELGHVLFTPSVTQLRAALPTFQPCLLADNLTAKGASYVAAFNILEDQRIETLMVAKFPSMRHYLVAVFVKYVIADGSKLEQKFLLSRGRRFLPATMRRMLRRRYANPLSVPSVTRIVDSYRTLNLTKAPDIIQAHDLVDELSAVIGNDFPQEAVGCPCGSAQNPSSMHGDKPDVDQREQDKLIRAIRLLDDDEDGPDGAGTGVDARQHTDDPDDPTLQDLQDEADKARQDRDSDVQVHRDMGRLRAIVNDTVPVADETVRTTHDRRAVPSSCTKIARDVAVELRKVEEDLDPHWDPHRETGRLSMQRAMHAEVTTPGLWDEWREGGQGGCDIELVTLLDYSISMSLQRDNLSQAAWAVKRASDILRVSATVLLYSDGRPVLFYGPKDRADSGRFTQIHPVGGTAPATALLDALNILAASKRARRIMLIMTDGDWVTEVYRHPVYRFCHEIIGDMNHAGIVTAMVHLGAGQPKSWHECTVRGCIDDMSKFPAYVRNLLVKQLRRDQS